MTNWQKWKIGMASWLVVALVGAALQALGMLATAIAEMSISVLPGRPEMLSNAMSVGLLFAAGPFVAFEALRMSYPLLRRRFESGA